MFEAPPVPDVTGSATQGSGLLATKLYARTSRADLVARPRLTRLLDDGRSASLILVSAPAGFGKTTLLAQWLAQRRVSAGWLSLDAADNDLARFLAYVFAALQGAVHGVADDLACQLRSPSPPFAESVLAAFVNELSLLPDDLTLILDDYHVITSPAVNAALTFLLENQPPNLHLVILSRADLPVPIARLRSRGQLLELRAGELRFTPDEAAAFLNRTMGLRLSPTQVARLDERVEGWIAGLQMAALSMRGRDDTETFIQAFAGTNRFILDFLVEEVLSREPEDVQDFLLRTAFLSRLCGPLCDAVTGGRHGRQMLERLERHNLFVVPLDDNRDWYRYHHLFADLLQARLYQAGPESVAPLQLRAAAWCEQEGQVNEAVGYALAAREYARAAELIAIYWGQIISGGEVETVWSWLEAMPRDVVRSSTSLSVACCWMLWLRGQIGAIEPYLLDAERALDQLVAPDGPGTAATSKPALAAQVATLRSTLARYANDFDAARAHAERALALMPRDLPARDDAQLRSLTLMALASAYDAAGDLERAVDTYAETIRLSRRVSSVTGLAGLTYRLAGILRLLGRLGAAERACREALRFVEEQGMARVPAAGLLHLGLAEVLVERNELNAAEAHVARANELGRRSGRLDAQSNQAPAVARLRLARGDADRALEAVDVAIAALGEPPSPLAKAEFLAVKTRVLIGQGALSDATRYADEAVRLARQDRGQTGELAALAASRVLAARSKPAEAIAQLTRSLVAAEGNGRRGVMIELLILRSLSFARQGALREAESDLQRALALAEPEGYVRIFVDEGEPLAFLIQRIMARTVTAGGQGADSVAYLATLRAAFAAPGQKVTPSDGDRSRREGHSVQPTALIEPLSGRELEVLRLMAEGHTNEQIAARLIIALGTVKAHIHNISGKLGAQNRVHAVARAKELALL